MKPRTAFAVLTLLTAALACCSVGAGAMALDPSQIVNALLGRGDSRTLAVLLELRLPRALTACAGGAGLAAAGGIMQTLFGNPLAGPDVLGINSGASLGIAALLLTAGDFAVVGAFMETLRVMGSAGLVAAATAGAAAVMFLIQIAAFRVRRPVTLLVLGMMTGYAVSSAVSIMISMAMPVQTQAFLSWSFGSFSGTQLSSAGTLAACSVFGIGAAVLLSKGFDALALGEENARSLGIDVAVLRRCAIASASLLAGAVTAFCGPVS
ncbi:MAG: iron chelate uptake ABC transporter family permease subunit, partial [Pyramidobacter sp.]|nr:iron chelate uptake ABC transporter family permease subunit [Pyramidobacter sp.]